jgi:hypothetical protein
MCESETVPREWLHSDGVIFDEPQPPAALTLLETASLPNSNARLVRGSELHRLTSPRGLPAAKLPSRTMLLGTVHPFDPMEYQPADIEPYLLPP